MLPAFFAAAARSRAPSNSWSYVARAAWSEPSEVKMMSSELAISAGEVACLYFVPASGSLDAVRFQTVNGGSWFSANQLPRFSAIGSPMLPCTCNEVACQPRQGVGDWIEQVPPKLGDLSHDRPSCAERSTV